MKEDSLRVLIVDSGPGFKERVKALFHQQSKVSKLGTAPDLQIATAEIHKEKYGMLVIDDTVREVSEG